MGIYPEKWVRDDPHVSSDSFGGLPIRPLSMAADVKFLAKEAQDKHCGD